MIAAAPAVVCSRSWLGPRRYAVGPDSAEARCGERLAAKYSVQSRYSKLYASQYKKKLKVSVTTHHGPLVEWQVQLYTFQGKLLGQTKRKRALNNTKTVRVDLKFPIQPGKFTIVIKGYPRGCHSESVTRRRGPLRRLHHPAPGQVPRLPGGVASDYGAFLSVPVESRGGALIKHPESEIFSFDGTFYGRNIDDYKRALRPPHVQQQADPGPAAGGYTMVVSGRLDQPRECGNKTAQVKFTLTSPSALLASAASSSASAGHSPFSRSLLDLVDHGEGVADGRRARGELGRGGVDVVVGRLKLAVARLELKLEIGDPRLERAPSSLGGGGLGLGVPVFAAEPAHAANICAQPLLGVRLVPGLGEVLVVRPRPLVHPALHVADVLPRSTGRASCR